MHLSIHTRGLLRGMVAGAVALASASACSRSDRATAGRDTTQTGAVAPADTQSPGARAAAPTNAAAPGNGDEGVAGYQAMSTDSSTASDTTATSTAASREVSSDTSDAGAAPMARDTSVALAQGDSPR